MSVIAVLISTDHDDRDEALRSVSNSLKRAGYDVIQYQVAEENKMMEVSATIDGAIEAAEPEVNERDNASRDDRRGEGGDQGVAEGSV